jgi:hypothetical protein
VASEAAAEDQERTIIPGVKKNVLVLGLVSFFTDIPAK